MRYFLINEKIKSSAWFGTMFENFGVLAISCGLGLKIQGFVDQISAHQLQQRLIAPQ